MRRGVAIVLCVFALFGLTGCSGEKPAENPNTRPAAVLPFEELPREVGFRRYDFADAGLENVLGFSEGHIEEILTIGYQMVRFYYDESERLLANSWGFSGQGEDIILADGTIVSNCCYNDGAERSFITRRTADRGIEWGSFDLDPLIQDPEVDFRSIIERYDPETGCFLVTYSRHDIPVRQENPPAESVRIEIRDLADLKYEAYSPDPESAARLIKAARIWQTGE